MSPPLVAPLPPVIAAPARKPSLISSPATIGSIFERNVEEWRIDNLSQFEVEFREIDKNQDRLVEGSDLRDVFLRLYFYNLKMYNLTKIAKRQFFMFIRSGLPQNLLARIWAYVDIQKSGRLNLEQYAKCVLLIRECKEEMEKAAAIITSTQTQPLPTQSATGVLGRRDSQISTNSVIQFFDKFHTHTIFLFYRVAVVVALVPNLFRKIHA